MQSIFKFQTSPTNKDRHLERGKKEEAYQWWKFHRPSFETFLLQCGPPQRTVPTAAFHRTSGRILLLLLLGLILSCFEVHFQWVLVVGHWGGEWVSDAARVSEIRALLVPLQPSCPTNSLFPLTE